MLERNFEMETLAVLETREGEFNDIMSHTEVLNWTLYCSPSTEVDQNDR